MDYKQKYYKYKSKFLKSKILQGGAKNDDSKDKKYKLEPKTLQFIQELENKKDPPIYTLPVDKARNVLNTVTKSSDLRPVHIENKDINGNISIRIIRPLNNNNRLPVILYYHGGGWVLGNKETHDRLVRELSVGTQAAVIFINYTPAPEAKFPTQINQAYNALLYVSQHPDEFNIDANNLVVVGDSVGGNMAIAVTLMAKEKKMSKIKYQVLLYPVTDSSMNTCSYKEFEDGPWLSKKSMQYFFDAYEPDINKRNDILISPLKASIDQLRDLPPALVITDENDVLRDEGEEYAHKLIQANVEVTAVRYLGTHHDFLILEPLKDTPAVKNAILLIISQLQKVFKQ